MKKEFKTVYEVKHYNGVLRMNDAEHNRRSNQETKINEVFSEYQKAGWIPKEMKYLREFYDRVIEKDLYEICEISGECEQLANDIEDRLIK